MVRVRVSKKIMDDILLLIFLLILSGFFSGAEIAIFSIGQEKIQALKKGTTSERKLRSIARLELLKSSPSRLLVTILIGNNVVNVASSALATVFATNFALSRGFESSTGMVIGVVTGVMTFLILLFGEITPKSFAHKHAVKFSLFVAPILNFLQLLLYPIVIPLAGLVDKFSGSTKPKHGLTEDELKAAIDLSEKEGAIETEEKELVEKVLEFNEHSVESIMTPRSKIFALPDDTSVVEALRKYGEVKFSRIPIFHETLDQVVGILTVHALAERAVEEDFKSIKVANLRLINPLKIPVTMKIDSLLRKFQREKMHMALVLDEYGGVVGLITLEDLMEEIFGDIEDEQDEERFQIRRIGKRKFLCSPDIELEQIEDFLQKELDKGAPTHFPWALEDENKTLGYLILEKLERFPSAGEKVVIKGHRVRFDLLVKRVDGEKMLEVELGV